MFRRYLVDVQQRCCELAVPSSPLQVKSVSFLSAASQLCHMDTGLAEKLWLELYPRLWTILLVRQ